MPVSDTTNDATYSLICPAVCSRKVAGRSNHNARAIPSRREPSVGDTWQAQSDPRSRGRPPAGAPRRSAAHLRLGPSFSDSTTCNAPTAAFNCSSRAIDQSAPIRHPHRLGDMIRTVDGGETYFFLSLSMTRSALPLNTFGLLTC